MRSSRRWRTVFDWPDYFLCSFAHLRLGSHHVQRIRLFRRNGKATTKRTKLRIRRNFVPGDGWLNGTDVSHGDHTPNEHLQYLAINDPLLFYYKLSAKFTKTSSCTHGSVVLSGHNFFFVFPIIRWYQANIIEIHIINIPRKRKRIDGALLIDMRSILNHALGYYLLVTEFQL